jgi:hypothetical protein
MTIGMLMGFASAGLAAQAETKNLGSFSIKVPSGWKSVETTSSMRKAQFNLPKAEGDKADAELVVFYFGPAGGGGVQANLDRWYGQFKQPDGGDTKDKAKSSKKKADGMEITVVDVSGTYVAAKQIGNPAAGNYNEKDYRMLAAIVPATDGDHFFKLVGPAKTVAKWAKDFDTMIAGIKKAK